MPDHSLAIHRFGTSVALTGLREDAPSLGGEIDRAVRDILPSALSLALEPLLGSRDGVLRIDRVALKLRLARGDISAVRIADLLAHQIAREVADRAEGGAAAPRIAAGLAYWPDHAAFAASYLAQRLGLAPAPAWAFPDFRALDLLAPHEAALELLAARPPIFLALAQLIGPETAPALASRFPELVAALLVERLASGVSAELTAEIIAGLAAMIAALPAPIGSNPGRDALTVAAKALAERVPDPDEAASVRQIIVLARLAVALAAVRAVTIGWGRLPVAADLEPAALARLPQPARSLAQAALTPFAQAPETYMAFADLLQQAEPRPIPRGLATSPAEQPEAPRSITSRHAGVGLLLPAALARGLPDLLSPAALHRLLAAALGPEVEAAARLDPLFAALAPFDPRGPQPAFPPVPEALRTAVPEAHGDGAAASEGAAGWAACLTHDFAAGLTGFEGSSLLYLRRQFLARPGTLHLAAGRLTLVLDPLPLGVVLRIAGLHGWTGRLPHAGNALLRIEIRDG